MKLIIFLATTFISMLAWGQSAALPGWEIQAQNLVNSMTSPWFISVGVMVVEFLMRFVKTTEPKSLLYVISNGFHLFATLFERLGGLLDGVLQNMTDVPAQAPIAQSQPAQAAKPETPKLP